MSEKHLTEARNLAQQHRLIIKPASSNPSVEIYLVYRKVSDMKVAYIGKATSNERLLKFIKNVIKVV